MTDTTNVYTFRPTLVGDGYHIDPEQVIEAAKWRGYIDVLIIGQLDTGEIIASSSAGSGEALFLMEKAKRIIVFGGEE